MFPITDIKSKAVIRKYNNPINIGGVNTQYGQNIIFGLFIRFPVFTRANKVTELSFYFNLQVIYFLEYQTFINPSSKQEFFDVTCKYPEVINPNCFFMLFS